MQRVLVSAFQCRHGGTSESYSAYKWVEQIARFNDVTLVTADDTPLPASVRALVPSRRFSWPTKWLREMNAELKLDYLWFNYQSGRLIGRDVSRFDIVHHVAPIAPRYPSALGSLSTRFVLGPIGGGLRVPPAFRADVEAAEPKYLQLRRLDHLRLRLAPSLKRTYDAAVCILVVGRYLLDLLPSKYHEKCVVMADTGVDASAIDYRVKTPADVESGIVRLLYAGRVVPYKGLIYALMALSRLTRDARARVRLSVVGDRGESAYERQCRRFVEEHGLHDNVRFHGYLPKAEVLRLCDDADLFIFPSLAEAGGNVVIEAMSKARPVLALNCGGPAEVVTADTGYVIDAIDPDTVVSAIRDALDCLLLDPTPLIEKGIAARRRVETYYDWQAKGSALRSIYNSLQ